MLRRCHCRPSLLASDPAIVASWHSRHAAVRAAPQALCEHPCKDVFVFVVQRAFSTLQRTVANCRRLVASAMHSCHMCCAASTQTLHVCVCMCTHFRSALAGVCESYGACSSERAQLLRPAARHSRTRTGRAHGSRFWTSVDENLGGWGCFLAACQNK